MSRSEHEASPRLPDHVRVAVIPAAAAASLLLARSLPIRFGYQPNDLGVVSKTTLAGYPTQQEIFWLVFATGVVSLLTWSAVRGLRRVRLAARAGIALEALGAGALAAVLYLPRLPGSLLFLLCVFAGFLLIRSASRFDAPLTIASSEPSPLGARRGGIWIAAVALIALAFTSFDATEEGLFAALAKLAHGVGDRQLVRDTWLLLGEYGQHLFWADSVGQGRFQGLDFFSLYGPLHSLGLLGLWGVFGRSIAVYELYLALRLALGMAACLLLVLALVRHRAVVLLAPCLVPFVPLRLGLGLLGLCLLSRCIAGGAPGWWGLASGFVCGLALLFSQEFGLALGLVAAMALLLRAELRMALWFGGGLLLPALPVLLWTAEAGALGPMLSDLVGYPVAMTAGYGNLPFPSLIEQLPLDPHPWREGMVRIAYAVPAIAVGGILLSLPLRELDPKAPWVSLGRARTALLADPSLTAVLLTALFGLLSFRSALGRSDSAHIQGVVPVAAALLCVGLDRCLTLFREAPALRTIAVWRISILAALVVGSGFLGVARTWKHVVRTGEEVRQLIAGPPVTEGDSRVLWLVDWIRAHTEPGEPVWFLPNAPAYYYLTERSNPIRFAMAAQVVTNAHRAEVLADLRERPPVYIVSDPKGVRVDRIPDALNLGEDVMEWIRSNYAEHSRERGFVILERR